MRASGQSTGKFGRSTTLLYSRALVAQLAVFMMFAITFAASAFGQTPMGSGSDAQVDTAIVFEPSKPLLETEADQQKMYRNSWGFDASFTDYGFGGGTYFSHSFSPEFTAELSLDAGSAKGPREFGIDGEDKINRIFVVPVMLSAQYRVFKSSLSESLKPYLTVGAGPVMVLTTPADEDFLPAFRHGFGKVVPGGFVGLGANFGIDKKNTFGANIRYFVIPYPGGVQSTSTQKLDNLNALSLTVNYGFNF